MRRVKHRRATRLRRPLRADCTCLSGARGETRTRTGRSPRDFRANYGFGRCARRGAFVAWTLPLPYSDRSRSELRQGPSSLYTFRGASKNAPRLSSGLPPPLRAEVSPNLTPFTSAVSGRVLKYSSSPLCLPVPPPGLSHHLALCCSQRFTADLMSLQYWRLGSLPNLVRKSPPIQYFLSVPL